jgi:hypothetical protein
MLRRHNARKDGDMALLRAATLMEREERDAVIGIMQGKEGEDLGEEGVLIGSLATEDNIVDEMAKKVTEMELLLAEAEESNHGDHMATLS